MSLLAVLILLYLKGWSQNEPLEVGTFTYESWNYERKGDISYFEMAKKEYEHQYKQTPIHLITGIPENEYKHWIMDQLVLGHEPDVFMVDDGMLKVLIEKGAVRALDMDNMSDTFRQGMLDGAMYENQLYGVPFLSQPRVMAVNMDLLKKMNIEKPRNNWTWQEFHKICRTIAKSNTLQKDTRIYGMVGYSWMDAFYANGMQADDDLSEQLQSREFWNSVKYLDALNELNGSDRILTEETFRDGKAVFMPMDYSHYVDSVNLPGKLERYVDIDWEILSMPAGPQGDNTSIQKGYYWVISSRSHKEAAAMDWINGIMSSHDYQEQIPAFFHGLPADKTIQMDDVWSYILDRSKVGFATASSVERLDIITQQIEGIIYEGNNLKASLIRARSKIIEAMDD